MADEDVLEVPEQEQEDPLVARAKKIAAARAALNASTPEPDDPLVARALKIKQARASLNGQPAVPIALAPAAPVVAAPPVVAPVPVPVVKPAPAPAPTPDETGANDAAYQAALTVAHGHAPPGTVIKPIKKTGADIMAGLDAAHDDDYTHQLGRVASDKSRSDVVRGLAGAAGTVVGAVEHPVETVDNLAAMVPKAIATIAKYHAAKEYERADAANIALERSTGATPEKPKPVTDAPSALDAGKATALLALLAAAPEMARAGQGLMAPYLTDLGATVVQRGLIAPAVGAGIGAAGAAPGDEKVGAISGAVLGGAVGAIDATLPPDIQKLGKQTFTPGDAPLAPDSPQAVELRRTLDPEGAKIADLSKQEQAATAARAKAEADAAARAEKLAQERARIPKTDAEREADAQRANDAHAQHVAGLTDAQLATHLADMQQRAAELGPESWAARAHAELATEMNRRRAPGYVPPEVPAIPPAAVESAPAPVPKSGTTEQTPKAPETATSTVKTEAPTDLVEGYRKMDPKQLPAARATAVLTGAMDHVQAIDAVTAEKKAKPGVVAGVVDPLVARAKAMLASRKAPTAEAPAPDVAPNLPDVESQLFALKTQLETATDPHVTGELTSRINILEAQGRKLRGEPEPEVATAAASRAAKAAGVRTLPQSESPVTPPSDTPPEKHDYSSTQIDLPRETADQVRALGNKIPDSHLAENGREDAPHVTVKYGLHGDDPEKVSALLADVPPITVKLGKTSVFPNGESGSGDVVKLDVDSPELHALNKKIADALPHTDTHPEYKPHATVAYVKPGFGKRHANNRALDGHTITVDRITFSSKDGTKTEIPLGGQKVAPSSDSAITAARAENAVQTVPTRDIPEGVARTPEAIDAEIAHLQERRDAHLKAGRTSAALDVAGKIGDLLAEKKSVGAAVHGAVRHMSERLTDDDEDWVIPGPTEQDALDREDQPRVKYDESLGHPTRHPKRPQDIVLPPKLAKRAQAIMDANGGRLSVDMLQKELGATADDARAIVAKLAPGAPLAQREPLSHRIGRAFAAVQDKLAIGDDPEANDITQEHDALEKLRDERRAQVGREQEATEFDHITNTYYDELVKHVQKKGSEESAPKKLKAPRAKKSRYGHLPVADLLEELAVTQAKLDEAGRTAGESFTRYDENIGQTRSGGTLRGGIAKKHAEYALKRIDEIETLLREQHIKDEDIQHARHDAEAAAELAARHRGEEGLADDAGDFGPPDDEFGGIAPSNGPVQTSSHADRHVEAANRPSPGSDAGRRAPVGDSGEAQSDTERADVTGGRRESVAGDTPRISSEAEGNSDARTGERPSGEGVNGGRRDGRVGGEVRPGAQQVAPGESTGPVSSDAGERDAGSALPGRRGTGALDVRRGDGASDSARGTAPRLDGEGVDSGDSADARGERGNARSDGAGQGDGEDGAGSPQVAPPVTPSTAVAPRASTPADGTYAENFVIEDDTDLAVGGPKARIAQNLAAIELARTLAQEGRAATAAEQGVLAKYVGWGDSNLAKVFDEHSDTQDKWAAERARLKSILSPAEYEAAKGSTLNAHYTSPEIIRGIYTALDHLGVFSEKAKIRALEPAAGIGHFIGLAPKADIQFTAVELDPTTASILKALYPLSDARASGIQDAKLPKGSFDLIVGNPPFGAYQVADPEYDKHKLLIHDYFFVKSLDDLRPGGILAFVTSNGTMDKGDSSARKLMAERANFLGGVRLPNTAFKGNAGTSVVTDVLFFQKPIDGGPRTTLDWTGTTGSGVNDYFAANPRQVLGKHATTGSMYRADSYTVEPTNGVTSGEPLQKLMEERLLAVLPKRVYTPTPTSAPNLLDLPDAPGHLREGWMHETDDGFHVVRDGKLTPVTVFKTNAERVRQLIALRDADAELRAVQLREDAPDRDFKRALSKANRLYDAFVKEFGPINMQVTKEGEYKRGPKKGEPFTRITRPNLDPFRADASYPLLMSLEDYDSATNKAKKATILEHRIFSPPVEIAHVDTPAEAAAPSLNKYGRIDLPYMAQLSGSTEEQVADAIRGTIAFENPINGVWIAADVYLSGNVKQKLAEAKDATKREGARFQPNVAALEKVIPEDLKPSQIYGKLGVPWIPDSDYDKFGRETFQGPVTVTRLNTKEGGFNVAANSQAKWSAASTNEYGTDAANGIRLFSDALNQRATEITWKDDDGKTHKDPEATIAAQAKQDLLKQRFQEWIWESPERAERLGRIYNDTYNHSVSPKIKGDFLEIPGTATHIRGIPFEWSWWQKDAIWRMITKGNTLLAHVVGAGKTFEMIAAGMEMKRLGMARKPLYVVPNHMLEQFSREFLQLYPNARVLIATKKDFEQSKRREFTARMASHDWDAIVMTHSSFEMIGVSAERQQKHIERELDELEDQIREAKADKSERQIVKALEAAKKRLKVKLERLMAKDKKDDLLSFEETGVDQLFVDEAHLFKNLEIRSKMRGMATKGAERSFDLLLKAQYLDERTPGRGLVLATGTPVSNSMAEVYTMQRYLQPGALRDAGIANFDAWAATFGESFVDAELAPDGSGYRSKERFARFQNIPELTTMFRQVADVKLAEDIFPPDAPGAKSRRPTLLAADAPILAKKGPGTDVAVIKGEPGKANMVLSPISLPLRGVVRSLITRAEDVKSKKVDPTVDNFLKITTEGRLAAMDLRLVSPFGFETPDSKITKAADRIAEIYKETAEVRGAQLVFSDIGTPKKDKKITSAEDAEGNPLNILVEVEDETPAEDDDEPSIGGEGLGVPGFSVYDEMRQKLVERGIPAKQVRFIHEAKTDVQKQQLMDDVKSGRVRVLIGSTEKMGAGMNVQDRLVALHHLDAPWRPSDIEQREGRIIRQGNKLWEQGLINGVKVFRYGTEGSFDAYMWQTLERKAGFIGPIMKGDPNVRSIEDLDSRAMDLAEMKAATSGNPLVKEKNQVDVAVNKLTINQRAHRDGQVRVRAESAALALELTRTKEYAAGNKVDAAKVVDLSGDNFKMKIGSATVTSRKEADEKLKGAIASAYREAQDKQQAIIGTFGGFRILLTFEGVHTRRSGKGKDEAKPWFRVALDGEKQFYRPNNGFAFDDIPHSPTSSIESLYRTIQPQVASYTDRIASLEEQKTQFDGQIGKKFPDTERLEQLKERQTELAGILKDTDDKNKEEPIVEEGSSAWWHALESGVWPYRPKLENDQKPLDGGPKQLGSGDGTVMEKPPAYDLFGNREEEKSNAPAQGSMFGDDAGTEATRSLKQTEMAGKTELALLRRTVDYLPPHKKQKALERIAYLSKIVERGEKIKGSDKPDGRMTLFEPSPAEYEAAQPFYSRLERAIESGPNRATVEQWKAHLAKDVAAGEREWTGIDQFFGNRHGVVSKEDVRKQFEAKRIKLGKKQIGGTQRSDAEEARLKELQRKVAALTDEYGKPIRGRNMEVFELNTEIRKILEPNLYGLPPAERAPYADYTEPGGTNYRILVVTLDAGRPTPESMRAKYGNDWRSDMTPDEDLAMNGVGVPDIFVSTHLKSVTNPLVHIRIKDRVLPDGRKVLHVEEIQSDWHQKGRKLGYGKEMPPLPPTSDRNAFLAELQRRDAAGAYTDDERRLRGFEPLDNDEFYDVVDETRNEPRWMDKTGKGIPDAPFKKTEEWTALALKHVIDEAVRGGYDVVAWTPGEKQAARYDLFKRVAHITYDPVAQHLDVYDTPQNVFIDKKVAPSELEDIIGKEATQRLLDSPARPAGTVISEITEDDYEDDESLAGKTLHHLTGDRLKMGGEGMRGYYDKIVPSVLRDYGKKIGVKLDLSSVTLDTGAKPIHANEVWELRNKHYADAPVRGMLENLMSFMEGGVDWRRAFREMTDANAFNGAEPSAAETATREKVERILEDASAAAGGKPDLSPEFPSFAVTPELRDRVIRKGQFIFEPTSAYSHQSGQPDLFTSSALQSEDIIGFGSQAEKDEALKRHRTTFEALAMMKLPTAHERRRQVARHQERQRVLEQIDVRGVKISKPEDAAKIMDLHRDPLVEKLHVFYLKESKGGHVIVGHTADTTGALNFVDTPDTFHEWVAATAHRLGASHVLFGHNHPSGDAVASSGDRDFTATATMKLEKENLSVLGHVVIDHNEFAWIQKDGADDNLPFNALPAEYETPREAGRNIVSRGGDVAALLRIVGDKDALTVILVDAQHRIVAVQPRPNGDAKTIANWLPPLLETHGAIAVYLGAPLSTARAISALAAGTANKRNYGWESDIHLIFGVEPAPSGNGLAITMVRPGIPNGARSKDLDRFGGSLERTIDNTNGASTGYPARGIPGRVRPASALHDSAGNAVARRGVSEDSPSYEETPGDDEFIPMPEPSGLGERKSGFRPKDMPLAAKRLLNPESIDANAKGAAGTIRHENALGARELAIATEALREVGHKIDKLTRAEQVDLWHKAETGQSTGDPERDAWIALLHQTTDHFTDELIRLGLLQAESAIEDYIGRFWSKPESEKQRNFLASIFSRRPLNGQKSFLKLRSLELFIDGLKAGLIPATYNFVESQLAKIAEMQRLISATKMLAYELEHGRAKKVMTSLGQKAPIDDQGDAWIRLGDEKDPAFIIYGPRKGAVIFPKEKADAGISSPAEDDEGNETVEEFKPNEVSVLGRREMGYWYAPKGAAAVWSAHLSRGFRGNPWVDAYLATTAAAAQIMLGFSGFHATVIATEGVISELALAIDAIANRGLKPDIIGGVKHAGKATIALGQAAWFGREITKEYMRPGVRSELAPVLDAMIAGGYRGAKTSEFWTGERKEALRKAWNDAVRGATAGKKVWGAARLPVDALYAGIELLSLPIMAKYVPWMKTAATYSAVAQKLATLPPDTTVDDMRKIMADIVKEMDYRFGQVVYDNHFINRATKDVAQMMFLAPGWTFGTAILMTRGADDVVGRPIRAGIGAARRKLGAGGGGAGGGGDEGNGAGNGAEDPEVPPELIGKSAAYWMGAFAATALINGILTYLHTGEEPKGKDYFAYRDGSFDRDGNPNRHVIPGYIMHDGYSWTHHPVQTYKNKLAPVLSFMFKVADNRNYFGDLIYNPDAPLWTKTKQVVGAGADSFGPIAAQNFLESKKRGESGPGEMARDYLGIGPAKREFIRTDAQNKMNEFLALRGHDALTPEEQELKAEARQIRDDYLDGKITKEDVRKSVDRGTLTLKQAFKITSTKQLNPLLRHFEMLKPAQAKIVYDLGTEDEQRLWARAMRRDSRKLERAKGTN